MRNKSQIEAEIKAVKMQLGIAEMMVETALESEKEQWRTNRANLELRLGDLDEELAAAESAPPVSDEPTAESDMDAMLNDILATPDEQPAEQAIPVADGESDMDAMLNDILATPDAQPAEQAIPVADGEGDMDAMLNDILATPDAQPTEQAIPVADGEGDMDAMLNDILFTPDAQPTEQAIPVADGGSEAPVLDDPIAVEPEAQTAEPDASEMEALLNEILDTPSEPQAAPEVTSMGASSAMLGEMESAHAAVQPIPGHDETAPQPEQFAQPEPAQPEPAQTLVPPPIVEAPVAQTEAPAPQRPARTVESVTDAVREAIFGVSQGLLQDELIEEKQQQAAAIEKAAQDFETRLSSIRSTTPDEAEAIHALSSLKGEVDALLARARRLLTEAAQIKLAAETDHAMYAAEDELQRGLRYDEAVKHDRDSRVVKEKLAEKIARRKAEITSIRNGIQNVKDSESAFVLREQIFSIQVVLDEEERNSPEITYLLTKTQDDVNHALEMAELKRRLEAVEGKKAAPKKPPAKKASSKKKKSAKKAAPHARMPYGPMGYRMPRGFARPRSPMRYRSFPFMRPYR